jgi:hypothetical protein
VLAKQVHSIGNYASQCRFTIESGMVIIHGPVVYQMTISAPNNQIL